MNMYKIKYDTRIEPVRDTEMRKKYAQAFTTRRYVRICAEDKETARQAFLDEAADNDRIISIRLFKRNINTPADI